MQKLYKTLSLKLRADVALTRDEASHFLPWIIALMVYLAALILAGSFTLDNTIRASSHAGSAAFSVHLPYSTEHEQGVAEKVLNLLKNTPGVESAEVVTPEQITQMVEPWFGKSDALANLPLPVIIDAKISGNAAIDFEALKGKITLLAPTASIDDHKRWMAQFAAFISVVRSTLMFIALLIILATASAVVFACKTSLKIHKNTVNLLHRLGAVDAYIATQFQNHAALLTLKGAFIGSGFAAFTMLGLHVMAHQLDSPLFPTFVFSLIHWFIILTLPFLMSGLALIVARFSVLSALSKVP